MAKFVSISKEGDNKYFQEQKNKEWSKEMQKDEVQRAQVEGTAVVKGSDVLFLRAEMKIPRDWIQRDFVMARMDMEETHIGQSQPSKKNRIQENLLRVREGVEVEGWSEGENFMMLETAGKGNNTELKENC